MTSPPERRGQITEIVGRAVASFRGSEVPRGSDVMKSAVLYELGLKQQVNDTLRQAGIDPEDDDAALIALDVCVERAHAVVLDARKPMPQRRPSQCAVRVHRGRAARLRTNHRSRGSRRGTSRAGPSEDPDLAPPIPTGVTGR